MPNAVLSLHGNDNIVMQFRGSDLLRRWCQDNSIRGDDCCSIDFRDDGTIEVSYYKKNEQGARYITPGTNDPACEEEVVDYIVELPPEILHAVTISGGTVPPLHPHL